MNDAKLTSTKYVYNVKVFGASIGITFSLEEAFKWKNESGNSNNAHVIQIPYSAVKSNSQ